MYFLISYEYFDEYFVKKSLMLIFHNYKWKYICLYDRNLFIHYARKIIKNQ